MKPTDFSKSLTDFLSKYLPGERGMSTNTIHSYKMTFILFINFIEAEKKVNVTRLSLKDITKEYVIEFLDWLQAKRSCSASTRNVRLAAIHSFFNYLQYRAPENMHEWQRILSIKVKKTKKRSVNYLTQEGIRILLAQPDLSTKKGRRDLAMFALMYDSAARVQEIIDLTPSNLRLTKPFSIKLVGKGNKARIVPLMDQEVAHLKQYMENNYLLQPQSNQYPLFYNNRREKLTRAGVHHILQQYAVKARKDNPNLVPEKLSSHSLRHSKAMHLLQAGVNLVYIRDILGHESVQTTEVYARVDSKQKREAIERAHADVIRREEPAWMNNNNLLEWLKSFV
jgi:site-specific recombinase XerD